MLSDVRHTDNLNSTKMTMTGEILELEIVDDNIDSSKILLVTKINNRIPRVTKLPALHSFLSHFAIRNLM